MMFPWVSKLDGCSLDEAEFLEQRRHRIAPRTRPLECRRRAQHQRIVEMAPDSERVSTID
jgi:hypothetical protein